MIKVDICCNVTFISSQVAVSTVNATAKIQNVSHDQCSEVIAEFLPMVSFKKNCLTLWDWDGDNKPLAAFYLRVMTSSPRLRSGTLSDDLFIPKWYFVFCIAMICDRNLAHISIVPASWDINMIQNSNFPVLMIGLKKKLTLLAIQICLYYWLAKEQRRV